jgi:hypothetical protein
MTRILAALCLILASATAHAQVTLYQYPPRPTPNDVAQQYLNHAQQQSQSGVQPPVIYQPPRPQVCQATGYGTVICR